MDLKRGAQISVEEALGGGFVGCGEEEERVLCRDYCGLLL